MYWEMTDEPITAKGRNFPKWPITVLFSKLLMQIPKKLGDISNLKISRCLNYLHYLLHVASMNLLSELTYLSHLQSASF